MIDRLSHSARGVVALFASIACLAAAPAVAQSAPDATAATERSGANDVPVGATTRALLDIQRNGTQAGKMLPLSGEQATLTYARYMRSFTHALPEFFTTQATGSPLRGGAGSQQMGAPSGTGALGGLGGQ